MLTKKIKETNFSCHSPAALHPAARLILLALRQVNVKKVRMGMNMLPTEVGPEEDATERGEPERDVFDELIGDGADLPSPPAERPATPPPATAVRAAV